MFKHALVLLTFSSTIFAQDAKLFTPGPLTTSASVKQAMQTDLGSRDTQFLQLNSEVMESIAQLGNVSNTHSTVPVQGSGTFAVEAMLGSLLGPDHKILLLMNGAYGRRMQEICKRLGKQYEVLQISEESTFDLKQVERYLKRKDITHVAVVYCETTTGILNPVPQIAKLTKRFHKELLIDAMSAFGGIEMPPMEYAALAASSNKCLQGVPGLSFALVRNDLLDKGYSQSLSLDLIAQHQGFKKNGQWRFTPPTHVILALHQAIKELKEEGGIPARAARYQHNCEVLHSELIQQGFKRLLPDNLQAPIIMTYLQPQDPSFNFNDFYQQLHQRGIVIYPGKLTQKSTFRLGCIGDLHEQDMLAAGDAIARVMGRV